MAVASLLDPPLSLAGALLSFDFDLDSLSPEPPPPCADADEAERESVMYQPLPLNTIPTG